MGFQQLAQSIARTGGYGKPSQPHGMKVSNRKIARHPQALVAKMPSRAKMTELNRPGNDLKARRHWMEGPGRPPLSIEP
jgi:hypothetical protein